MQQALHRTSAYLVVPTPQLGLTKFDIFGFFLGNNLLFTWG